MASLIIISLFKFSFSIRVLLSLSEFFYLLLYIDFLLSFFLSANESNVVYYTLSYTISIHIRNGTVVIIVYMYMFVLISLLLHACECFVVGLVEWRR